MGVTTQNQQCDSAGWKSLTKHAGQKFLTNPDALGKIRNNREGELAIGNYRELSGPSFSRFIWKNQECRISVSGIAIILQIFSQMPARFLIFCRVSSQGMCTGSDTLQKFGNPQNWQ
jgi:hypothetical protein